MLGDVWKWYKDESVYLADNRTKVGGKVTSLPGLRAHLAQAKTGSDGLLPWQAFNKVVQKWHRKVGLVSFPDHEQFFNTYSLHGVRL